MMTVSYIIMRTIIEITDEQQKALAAFCAHKNISRAEAVRRAVDVYLKQEAAESGDDVFGLWKGRGVDALGYEQRLRDEWRS